MAPARSSIAMSLALALSFMLPADSFVALEAVGLLHARGGCGSRRSRNGGATLMLADSARPARAARARRGPSEEEDKKFLANLELEYWGSLDSNEYKAARKQAVGVEMLKLGQLEDAAAAFAEALEARPDIYLWHRGVALYYLGHYSAAASHFLRDARLFEKRFEEAATDDRIWAAASLLRSGAAADAADAVAGAAAGGISGEEKEAEEPPVVAREQNALKAAVLELFLGRCGPEAVREVMGLRSSSSSVGAGVDAQAGSLTPTSSPRLARDYTGRRFFGHFYLSLWHECGGRHAEARRELEAAMATGFPKPGSGDFWLQLPPLVARLRGWDGKPNDV